VRDDGDSAAGIREVRVGCTGWNYAHWREVFYPKALPAGRWLQHYATFFDTVEVNSTFYRLARPTAVARWLEQTPPGFVFAIKASRYLTHVKRLKELGEGVARFYESIEPLLTSPKLGPILWQLPGSFHRDDERLAAALERIRRFNNDWYAYAIANAQTLKSLLQRPLQASARRELTGSPSR
jgi:uncharacterized protein YecE (DUF72 family)